MQQEYNNYRAGFDKKHHNNNQSFHQIQELFVQIYYFEGKDQDKQKEQIYRKLTLMLVFCHKILIVRTHYFYPIIRQMLVEKYQQIRTKLKMLTQDKIDIEMYSNYVLKLSNNTTDTQLKQTKKNKSNGRDQQTTKIEKMVKQLQNSKIIIRIFKETKVRIKFTNMELFKQNQLNLKKDLKQIQKYQQQRLLCFNQLFERIKKLQDRSQHKKNEPMDEQQMKIFISTIFDERVSFEIILQFNRIQTLLQVYQESQNKHRNYHEYFYLQPFNQVQGHSQIKVLYIQDSIISQIKQFIRFENLEHEEQHMGQKQSNKIKLDFQVLNQQKNTKSEQNDQFRFKQKKQFQSPSQQIQSNNLYQVPNIIQYQTQLKSINRQLANSSIFKLKSWMSQNFRDTIEHMIRNYQVYVGLRAEITKFFKINQYKWFRAKDLYQAIYPQMPHYIKCFLNKARIPNLQKDMRNKQPQQYFNNLKKSLGIDSEHFMDIIYYKYYQQNKQQRKAIMIIQQQQFNHLPDYINFYTSILDKQDLINNLLSQYKLNTFKGRNDQNQGLVQSILCLGCVQSLKQKIYIDTTSKCPVTVFLKIESLLKQSSKMDRSLKRQICSMMNSGGGIILFDCIRRGNQIRPCGALITLKQRQKYQQIIYKLLDKIHPPVQKDINVSVAFIPVNQNAVQEQKNYPSQILQPKIYNQKCPNQTQKQKPIPHCYVTRITVYPTDATMIYFWQHDQSSQEYYWSFRTNKKISQIKYHQACKLVKSRFKEFYIPIYLTPRQKKMMKKQNNLFGHKCPVLQSQINKTQELKIEEIDRLKNHQDKFKYLSLLQAKKKDHSMITMKLQARGIECQIKQSAAHKYFESSNRFLVYHDVALKEIQNVVWYNPEFIFDNKIICFCQIKQYIRFLDIKDMFAQFKIYSRLKQWLNKQFPKQSICLWRGTDGNQTYYCIWTKNKYISFYLFNVLIEFEQRVCFQDFKEEQLVQITRQYQLKITSSNQQRTQRQYNTQFGNQFQREQPNSQSLLIQRPIPN